MTIKKYINHISLPDGLAHIVDPLDDFSPNGKLLSSKDVQIIPGDYACYIIQDYANNPVELRLISDSIFSFVKEENEIVFPEYIGSVTVANYLGIFDSDYHFSETKYIKFCNFLNEHNDNTYHVNKPWFNTFLFKKKLHDDFEGVFIRVPPKEYPIYALRNKYRKIVALKLMVM